MERGRRSCGVVVCRRRFRWGMVGGAFVLSAFFFLFIFLPLPFCHAQDSALITVGAARWREYLPKLQGKNVGLVCNQTSIVPTPSDSTPDTHLVDFLLSRGVCLKTIFTPEHGFRGTADAGEQVAHSELSGKNIRIFSLYGRHKRMIEDDLRGIDIVLFDLQDVGVRCYTYISTLHYVMQSCAGARKELIVLDRPNPNGHYVDGPVLDPSYQSFVGMHPVPWVHGMTVGEYARMINGEEWLAGHAQCQLTVVPCMGYTHTSAYVLPVAPSPNLKTQNAIYLYPSLALFEGTSTSVGRGTDTPFELVGSPRGSREDFAFTPMPHEGAKKPKYMRRKCYGLDLRTWRDSSWQSAGRFRLSFLLYLYRVTGKRRDFFSNFFDRLAGSPQLRLDIELGKSENEIREGWQQALDAFKSIRAKYLLYPDFSEPAEFEDISDPAIEDNPEDNRYAN